MLNISRACDSHNKIFPDTSSVFAIRDAPKNVSTGDGQGLFTLPALCAVYYNFFSQLSVNRVTIENAKKRHGLLTAAGGPDINNIDSKVIYPRQVNSVPTNQVGRTQHVYERNKSQTPNLYFPRYVYRNRRSLPNQ